MIDNIIVLQIALLVTLSILIGWFIYTLCFQKSNLNKKLNEHFQHLSDFIRQEQSLHKDKLSETLLKNQALMHQTLIAFSEKTSETHQNNLQRLQTSLRENLNDIDKQMHTTLTRNTNILSEQFEKLTQATQQHLHHISESVEARLTKGFEKTNETFTNIIQRLAIIDDAQKKITDLSENVVSLQAILSDKRSRGAFGEVQLNVLIQNVLPNTHYSLQHTLSNGSRADCLLLLPEPTGNIVIDAKFPLENYQKFLDLENSDSTRTSAKQQFKIDIKKHIQDIQQKYIIPGETSDGALMFIPAEAIFAEIHAHHPDLVEFAWQSRVWLASPSTMMAILTTACAVLKDSATRQQVHVIQEHLRLLAQDFTRFEKRMDNLSRHIEQANQDAALINTSAQKISKRFHQIEKVELSSLEPVPLQELTTETP